MKQKKFISIITFISILSAFLIVTSVLSQTKSGGGVNIDIFQLSFRIHLPVRRAEGTFVPTT